MTKKSYTRVKTRDFKLIKALTDAKVPTKKITDITGRGSSTIWYIKKSATLAEYKQRLVNMRKATATKKENGAEEKVEKKQPSQAYVNTITEELVEIKKVLMRIDTTLRTATEGQRSLKLK